MIIRMKQFSLNVIVLLLANHECIVYFVHMRLFLFSAENDADTEQGE